PQSAFEVPDLDHESPELVTASQEALTLQLLEGLYEANQPFESNAKGLEEIAVESLFLYSLIRNAEHQYERRSRPEITRIGNKKYISHVSLDRPGPRKFNDTTAGLTAEEMLPR